jgi:hypothetical protein
MISYYLFMGLLIITLILWAILAILPEEPKDGVETDADSPPTEG